MFGSSSLRELYLARLREFYRQPARIFWVYGFPMLLAIGLGLAFRNPAAAKVDLDLVESSESSGPIARLLGQKGATLLTEGDVKKRVVPGTAGRPDLEIRLVTASQGESRVNTGKTPLLVWADTSGRVTYQFDPTRPEASSAKLSFDDALQAANGRESVVATLDQKVTKNGSRYIDFLIPGLIGQNTMGGGLWGVGFLIVNFRLAKLLKRFAATPMPRRDFLLAILGARLTFLIPDVGVLLALGYFGFGMPIAGSLWLIILVEIIGAMAFSGIGLLIACRAKTTETVSGLMNLVMLPMWIFSGLFFSSERFPSTIQPFIQALPLTQLLNALRAVILEGAVITDHVVWFALAVLSAWSLGTFLLALRFFRWS